MLPSGTAQPPAQLPAAHQHAAQWHCGTAQPPAQLPAANQHAAQWDCTATSPAACCQSACCPVVLHSHQPSCLLPISMLHSGTAALHSHQPSCLLSISMLPSGTAQPPAQLPAANQHAALWHPSPCMSGDRCHDKLSIALSARLCTCNVGTRSKSSSSQALKWAALAP